MILTRKRLLVDIFSHSQIIKVTRILQVCDHYFEALHSQLKPHVKFYCFNQGQVVWKPINAANQGMTFSCIKMVFNAFVLRCLSVFNL